MVATHAIRRATGASVVALALGACGGVPADIDPADTSGDGDAGHGHPPDRPQAVALVWPDAWVLDPDGDVLPDHAPAEVECSVGFRDELGVFEIDTGLCNYGVFSQPSAAEVFAGERVEFVFTHDDLTASEPAIGHVAVAIGGHLVWETEVAIPKPYGIVTGEWVADAAVPAGTPVALHLHNHGYNNWRVIGFQAGGR